MNGSSWSPMNGSHRLPMLDRFTAPFPLKEMYNGKSNDQQVHPMNAQGDYASEAEAIA